MADLPVIVCESFIMPAGNSFMVTFQNEDFMTLQNFIGSSRLLVVLVKVEVRFSLFGERGKMELSKNQARCWNLDFLALALVTSLCFSRLDYRSIMKIFSSQFYIINERDFVPVKDPQIMKNSLFTEMLKISLKNNLRF